MTPTLRPSPRAPRHARSRHALAALAVAWALALSGGCRCEHVPRPQAAVSPPSGAGP